MKVKQYLIVKDLQYNNITKKNKCKAKNYKKEKKMIFLQKTTLKALESILNNITVKSTIQQ